MECLTLDDQIQINMVSSFQRVGLERFYCSASVTDDDIYHLDVANYEYYVYAQVIGIAIIASLVSCTYVRMSVVTLLRYGW